MADAAPDEEIEEGTMSLVEHLAELRTRLIRSVLAFIIGMVICFSFAGHIIVFLAEPITNTLIAQGAIPEIGVQGEQDGFFTFVHVSLVFGLGLSFPVIAHQMWRFVAPGLYRDEKTAFLPFIIASPALFVLGGAFAHYVVTPLAMNFFLSFIDILPSFAAGEVVRSETSEELRLRYYGSIRNSIGLTLKFIFAFGICFQLPVLLTLMGKAGLVSSKGLKEVRKYAIVGILVVAALLTPPDVVTQVILFGVVYALYEISIWLVAWVERARTEELRREGVLGEDEEL